MKVRTVIILEREVPKEEEKKERFIAGNERMQESTKKSLAAATLDVFRSIGWADTCEVKLELIEGEPKEDAETKYRKLVDYLRVITTDRVLDLETHEALKHLFSTLDKEGS